MTNQHTSLSVGRSGEEEGARLPCAVCGERRLFGEPGWRVCGECGWDELPIRTQATNNTISEETGR